MQFGINKHEQIFQRLQKIARYRRASAICSLRKILEEKIKSSVFSYEAELQVSLLYKRAHGITVYTYKTGKAIL